MRVMLDTDPFYTVPSSWAGGGAWPASWIRHPEALGVDSFVGAYRLKFSIPAAKTVRLHVSADERYEIYLDGERFGRGPERGDMANWFFETYDLHLAPGDHTIVAHSWWLGTRAPYAQMSYRPGFLAAADDAADKDMFNTGHASWEALRIDAYDFTPAGSAFGTGSKLIVHGDRLPWGFERGEGDGWVPTDVVLPARNKAGCNEYLPVWNLRHAILPPMVEETVNVGAVQHIETLQGEIDSINTTDMVVLAANHVAADEGAWASLVAGSGAVTVPAKTTLRAIVDLRDYYCAYPELILSGGAGAVRIEWAESLYIVGAHAKGNRDAVEGKRFHSGGVGDTFKHDGGLSRRYSTLWWQAGRYIQVIVATGDQPLTIDALALRQTHYPYDVTSRFDASDPRLGDVVPIAVRAMEMCSHETYMDCPYYEQLMYVGDTRLEVLTTYAMGSDDRLPRKALELFDASRHYDGLTTSRYPSRVRQVIPPFSLWWVAMVHDYAYWRADTSFVKSLMPGVRAVIDAYAGFINVDGLVERPNGWNFMDWVPSWGHGVPPDGETGVSGLLNWHFIYVLGLAADLELLAGEHELASRYERLSASLVERTTVTFYDDDRGLFADDIEHTKWSEHSQCLALLARRLPRDIRQHVAEGLCNAADLERTTIYFSHYLFETYRVIRRDDLLFQRLGLWFGLKEGGFKTTFESPEPSRSDCHAWGAHPLFHYYATILGIRPTAANFAEIEIDPQLGPLTHASGTYPHPAGPVEVTVKRDGERLTGTVTLPEGLVGVLHLGKAIRVLQGGTQKF